MACGNIREIEVNIVKSTYKPASGYLFLKENLELLLLKAKKIENPFEQSFFVLLHLSYLQAFEDVNKRTARLACNIPFIKSNKCPLSFTGLPKEDYILAIVIFYELNNFKPMIDLFKWSYLKSCERYDGICESIGNIDEFRVKHRKQRKYCMGEVIRKNLHGQKIENIVRTTIFIKKIDLLQ
jgi:Fic family protein